MSSPVRRSRAHLIDFPHRGAYIGLAPANRAAAGDHAARRARSAPRPGGTAMRRWKARGAWLPRLWRRWRPDANPLRRTTDRMEAALLAVLIAAFLLGAPLAGIAAGRAAAASNGRAGKAPPHVPGAAGSPGAGAVEGAGRDAAHR